MSSTHPERRLVKKIKRKDVSFDPSRAIVAFARPLLAEVADLTHHDVTKQVLKLATTLWNATTLDERGEPGAMASIEGILSTMPEHLQVHARAMIAKRRADFSRADYLLRDVDVVEDVDGKMRVTAASDAPQRTN